MLPDPAALEAGQLLIDDDVYRIVAAEWHDERNVNVRLAGVRTRNAAQALKGKQVSVDPGWYTEEMGRPLASYLGMKVINDESDEFVVATTAEEVRVRPIPGLLSDDNES